jgi:acetyltransferase-like isoleucine patch superfamily enzyme
VRQNLRIGRDSLVGMGSVVIKDVPPSSVMAGNPARKLRDVA